MKLFNLPKSLAVSVVAGLAAIFLCFLTYTLVVLRAGSVEDWFNVMRTSQNIPDVQAHFDQVYNEVTSFTEDSLLEELVPEPLHVPPVNYTHCIRGRKTRIYGTNRPYEDVFADYREIFEKEGWQHIQLDGLLAAFSFAETVEIEISPTSIDYVTNYPEWNHYETIYSIRFRYAEPGILACWG